MLNMLEQHSEQLEEVLGEKVSQLESARLKGEAQLLTRLPRSFVNERLTSFLVDYWQLSSWTPPPPPLDPRPPEPTPLPRTAPYPGHGVGS